MNHNRSRYDILAAIVFPASLGIGTAVGALIHNIGVGLAVGAGAGTVFSLTAYYLGRAKADRDDQTPGQG
ncbi:MAG: hypothetical protein ACWGO1_10245 [Anaerolineales bacterium]